METLLNILEKIYNATLGWYFNCLVLAFQEGRFGNVLLLLLPFIILFILIASTQTPEEVAKYEGDEFEKKSIKSLYVFDNIFQNIILPLRNNGTTEIDLVAVSHKGIFCIECKKRGNDNLVLYGAMTSEQWEIRNGIEQTVGQIANPLKQNMMHIEVLESLLPKDINGHIYNVVFSNTAFDLMWSGICYKGDFINLLPEGVVLLNTHGNTEFNKQISALPDAYTDEEISKICSFLKKYEGNNEQRAAHVKYVKGKHE